MKKCNKCQKIKPEGDFYEGNAKCKDCKREYQQNYRANNLEAVKVSVRLSMDKARFGRSRTEILERDGYKCAECRIVFPPKNLDIHHIDGEGRHSDYPNNHEDNLETMCKQCHGSLHGKEGK